MEEAQKMKIEISIWMGSGLEEELMRICNEKRNRELVEAGSKGYGKC
ncbi:MAG: hypothetical protein DDT33_01408 [Firmicutes bacterium]|nr:MAG: hypothetical protein BME93_02420 [Methanosarcinales archaeon Met12]MBT9132878.1 hypothetical protein [Bacillota bacterium]